MAVLRRLITFAIVILTAGLIVYALSFVFVLRTGALDERLPADAIVVLGAAQYDGRPSPVLEARLDHALILYEAGLAPVVVLTGGIGAGDTTSEAMVSKRYLEARNIPAEALVVGDVEGVAKAFRELASMGYTYVIVRSLVPDQAKALGSIARLGEVRRLVADA